MSMEHRDTNSRVRSVSAPPNAKLAPAKLGRTIDPGTVNAVRAELQKGAASAPLGMCELCPTPATAVVGEYGLCDQCAKPITDAERQAFHEWMRITNDGTRR